MAAPKLELGKTLRALDKKDRAFYDSLSDDEKKGFSGYLLLRYASVVESSNELIHYYLASTNHYANRDFFALNKHPKLQWLCLTAVSPGLGTVNHKWIATKKKKGTADKRRKVIEDLFPSMKAADIDALLAVTTEKDLNEYIRKLGSES